MPGGRFREFYYWDTYWIVKGKKINVNVQPCIFCFCLLLLLVVLFLETIFEMAMCIVGRLTIMKVVCGVNMVVRTGNCSN